MTETVELSALDKVSAETYDSRLLLLAMEVNDLVVALQDSRKKHVPTPDMLNDLREIEGKIAFIIKYYLPGLKPKEPKP